jgi:phosphatidylglycerophosphatase A
MEGRRLPIRLLRDPYHCIAMGFGAGLAPRAPGTAGSALALVPCWLMLSLEWPLRLALAAAALVLGVWICGESSRRLGAHDHPAIVLDEIAAMMLMTVLMPQSAVWLFVAFVLFRIFDIAKPWPIRDLDHRMTGGLGIMLDDQLAAIYASACMVLIRQLTATL